MYKPKDSFFYKLAKQNTRLSHDIYKKMIKDSPLIGRNMSIKAFREAYHSAKTTNEIRAMLLHSVYDEKPDFLNKFRALSNNPLLHEVKEIKITPMSIDGKKAFTLGAYDWGKGKVSSIPINRHMKEEIRLWRPITNKYRHLTKALLSGNAQAQKVSMYLGEISTAMYAMVDLLVTNAKLNDPFLLYLIESEDEETDDKLNALTEEEGHYKKTQTQFYRDISHMANEFNKLFPTLNKLGIKTIDLEVNVMNLSSDVYTFINKDYTNIDEEANALYEGLSNLNETITSSLEIIKQIDELDITDPAIYNIGRLAITPKFIDYSQKKIIMHRRAAKEPIKGLVDRCLRDFRRTT